MTWVRRSWLVVFKKPYYFEQAIKFFWTEHRHLLSLLYTELYRYVVELEARVHVCECVCGGGGVGEMHRLQFDWLTEHKTVELSYH